MRAADVASILEDAQTAPCACLLELPHRELGGKLVPMDDLEALSETCRAHGVALHMDGARLWEAQAGYGCEFKELTAHFDSVYVSFYKGLGGLSGAMLLGSETFCDEARVW